jgi:hypothetical protein
MAYLHCERCGLQTTIQVPVLRVENCPRCLARSATVSPMTLMSSLRPAIDRAAQPSDVQRAPESRLAAVTRRANQGVLAASVRALRSQDRPHDRL